MLRAQRRALFRHFSTFEPPKVVRDRQFLTLLTWNLLRATTACTFSTSQLPKVVRTWRVLYIFTWKCASRHNGVHFFDISTSKSGPTLRCFVPFHFEMCFAHNGVHFFGIATSKSGPELRCFVPFDLQMCFAPQRRATFHLSSASCLRTRRFNEPTFRPSWATNHWKNSVFRDFPTFSRICILLSSDSFSSDLLSSNLLFSLPLPCSAFHLSILSEV